MAGKWAESCHPKEEQEVGVVAETLRKKVQGVSHPGLPCWLSWQRIRLKFERPGFDPWVGKIPWRREWLPIPVLQYLLEIDIIISIWDSLVAQVVKNPPVMQEIPVQSLGRDDPLEKGQATHSSIHWLP